MQRFGEGKDNIPMHSVNGNFDVFIIFKHRFKNNIVDIINFRSFAFPGAADKLHQEGIEMLSGKCPGYAFADSAAPFILLFLSGGSEAEAVSCLSKDHFQVLLGTDHSNAFASAMEVKAFSIQEGCRNVLLNMDDPHDLDLLKGYLSVHSGLGRLKGRRLGLIGEVSEWLVASDVSAAVLKGKLGIDLVKIPWGEAGNYRDHYPVNDFFTTGQAGSDLNIADAGRVSALLESVIRAHRLDAVTVECFSLVKENQVTACLGLSYLNDKGLPAGCEGDLCSVTGIMLVKEILGKVPWMANVAGIKGNQLMLAHCTAPTSLLENYVIDTHFETGEGTAIRGSVDAEEVSVFRVNNTLDGFFIARGRVIEQPYVKNTCRTQLHVELSPDKIRELRSAPLGNHHLVVRGDLTKKLELLAEYLAH